MNQDQNNQYPRFGQQGPQQYGLSSFDAPRQRQGLLAKVFGSRFAEKFNNPLFSTAAFVVAAVALAGVIYAAYPSGDSEGEVPVVRADTLAFKEAPSEPGGMSIANRESTIFEAMNNEGVSGTTTVENLLAEDEPEDKLAAFAREVEASVEDEAGAVEESAEESVSDFTTMASADTEEASDLIQKIEPKVTVTTEEIVAVEPAAGTATASAPKVEERPVITHKAGENPDTIDFVRSVLDKKDAGEASKTASATSANDVATRAASVQPASGSPADFTISPGAYYVQLGSVKSLDGASGEWGRLQKEYSAELSSASHRVQAADLGDRGTFYRIQAGPMSKDSASKICDSIKAQKPGGCLVTQ